MILLPFSMSCADATSLSPGKRQNTKNKKYFSVPSLLSKKHKKIRNTFPSPHSIETNKTHKKKIKILFHLPSKTNKQDKNTFPFQTP
jgi:hypothetical protein